MSPSAAFPDFSPGREHTAERAFVCTLKAGDSGPAWVHVAGDLDVSSAPRLEHALRHTDTPPRLVVLNLRSLASIDATGAQTIVDAAIRARRARRRLMLLRGRSQADRMLAMSGASHVLEIVDLGPLEPFARPQPLLVRPDDAA